MIMVLQLCLFKNSLCILNISPHTATCTHTHTCTYALTQCLTCCLHTCKHILWYTIWKAYTYTFWLSHTPHTSLCTLHTHTHSCIHTVKCRHSPIHSNTHSQLTLILMHTHTFTHWYTLRCSHAHTHIHTSLFHIYTHSHTHFLLQVCTPTSTCSHVHIAHSLPPHLLSHLHKNRSTLSHRHTLPSIHAQLLHSHLQCSRPSIIDVKTRPRRSPGGPAGGLPHCLLTPGQGPSSPASPNWAGQAGDPKVNFKERKWPSIRLNSPAGLLAAPNPTFRSQILPPGTSSFMLNIFCMVTWISSNTRETHESLGITVEELKVK